jgi:gluconate 2-dehydrogenase gamma chain
VGKDRVSRKDFVVTAGALGALAGSLADAAPAEAAAAAPKPAAHAPAAPKAAKPLTNEPEAYIYFTAPEVAFVEAAVARLIPNDALGPGARESGVAYFIDQQLTGQYGYAAKMYRDGPWPEALPTQGYQLPLSPREVYRLGIIETDAHSTKTYGKAFAELDGAHQDLVLADLDGAKVVFDSVPAKVFFEMLYANTVEGFFADPIYGGNRNKAGWKLVGFPGVAAAYISLIERHNVPYHVNPVGIADVEQTTGMIEEDDHHVLVHRLAVGNRAGKS